MLKRHQPALLAALAILLAACGGSAIAPAASAQPSAAAFPTTLADFQGRSVSIAAPPRRIVSIGPSNTEFLYALGAGDRVVGVDDFSDTPAAARTLPRVGGVKVNLEQVVALRPDLVVMVKISDGTVEKLSGAGVVLVVVDPQGVADVAKTATLLGQAIGADGRGLAASIEAKVGEVRKLVAATTSRPRVYHEVDASDPAKIFTVGPGSYINDLIEIGGGTNIASRAGSAYPQLSVEEIVRADPEIIVVSAADYAAKPAQIAARPGWSGMSAVKSGRILSIEGNLVNRPGPRVGEAAQAYAKLMHPEAFR